MKDRIVEGIETLKRVPVKDVQTDIPEGQTDKLNFPLATSVTTGEYETQSIRDVLQQNVLPYF